MGRKRHDRTIITKFRNHGPLSRRTKFLILALVPVYFMAAGLILQPADEVWRGIITIIREPDFLITDYIAIGELGPLLSMPVCWL